MVTVPAGSPEVITLACRPLEDDRKSSDSCIGLLGGHRAGRGRQCGENAHCRPFRLVCGSLAATLDSGDQI